MVLKHGGENAKGQDVLAENNGAGEEQQVYEDIACACGICAIVVKTEVGWTAGDLVCGDGMTLKVKAMGGQGS